MRAEPHPVLVPHVHGAPSEATQDWVVGGGGPAALALHTLASKTATSRPTPPTPTQATVRTRVPGTVPHGALVLGLVPVLLLGLVVLVLVAAVVCSHAPH